MTNLYIHSLAVALIFLAIPVNSGAEELRSGFPLMMEIADTRLISLGGAALTESGESGCFLSNPATLYGSRANIAASYARLPIDIWSGNLSLIKRWHRIDFGLSFQTYNYGSMDESIVNQGPTGRTFTASENLLGLAVAGNMLDYGSWGVAGKIDWQNLDGEDAVAAGFDAGITVDPRWEQFKLGLSIRNLGSEIGGKANYETPTPFETSFAVSKKLAHLPLTVFVASYLRRTGEGDWNVDFLPGEPGLAFGAGGEFDLLPKGAENPIQLRFGYRSIGQGLRVGNSADTFAGFSFGLGLNIKYFKFDYAYAPLGALGQVHRMGIARTI